MWSLRFQALTIVVEFVADSEAVVPGLVAILGSYPRSDRAPVLTYSIHQNPSNDSEATATAPTHKILRNGDVVDEAARRIDVPSILERDLFQQCIAHATDCVVLHGAAIAFDEVALVMAGPSGSGKSTLTRALLAEGAEYLSDECVAIRADGQVLGLGPPHLSRSAPGRRSAHTNWFAAAAPMGRRDRGPGARHLAAPGSYRNARARSQAGAPGPHLARPGYRGNTHVGRLGPGAGATVAVCL